MPTFDVSMTYRVEAETKQDAVLLVQAKCISPVYILSIPADSKHTHLNNIPDPSTSVKEVTDDST